MKAGVGQMGCSVTELSELGNPFIPKRNAYGTYGTIWDYEVMLDGERGFKALQTFVSVRGGGYEAGGVCLFADSSTHGNGARLSKWLRKHGARVEKCRAYANPSHGGKCTVWVWYHREEPNKAEVEDAKLQQEVVDAPRPVPRVRRTTLLTKAKTVARRVTGKRANS